jgi:hypothetical protein
MTSKSRDADQISMSWLVTKWVRLVFLLPRILNRLSFAKHGTAVHIF